MSKELSFLTIQNFADILDENEFFTQFYNDKLPDRYDSNYVLLHFSPTVQEFLIIENIQKEYIISEAADQIHLKFRWPENTGIMIDLLDYLSKKQYKIGKEELMYALPHTIDIGQIDPKFKCEIVNKDKLGDFFTLNYKDNLLISNEFADFSERTYHYQFEQPNTEFLMVTINDLPVASLTLHISDNFIEIDHVLTDKDYRKQGIASHMIHYVMNVWNGNKKPLILVVDAEDTPKNLYEKLGFKVISSQISVEKILTNQDLY